MKRRQVSSSKLKGNKTRSGQRPNANSAHRSSAAASSSQLTPATILQMQATVGNKSVQRLLAEGSAHLGSPVGHIQRKPAPGKVHRQTHLVKMQGRSLLEGQQQQRIFPNDVLELDDQDKYWSRRGVDGEKRREFHRNESPYDYKWFRVLKHNGADISDQNLYVRYTAFDFMAPETVEESVGDAKQNDTLRDMLRETEELLTGNIRLGEQTKRLFARFGAMIDDAPDSSGVNKSAFDEAIGSAIAEIDDDHIGQARAIQKSARAERYKANPTPENIAAIHNEAFQNRQNILGALAHIELETINVGRRVMSDRDEDADEEGNFQLWQDILALGDQAYDLRVEGTAEANQRVETLSSSTKEKLSTAYGIFSHIWDAWGVIAASIASLATITALSAVIAGVGIFIGAIGAVLGLGFGLMTRLRAKDLSKTQQKLAERGFSPDLVNVAEYAKKQKKKKKKRQFALAAGGLAVAIMAGIGLAGGPLAIIMAVLGAAVGIGFVLYKWYRKKKGKKRAMQALVKKAIDKGDPESIATLNKLGITDEQLEAAAEDEGQRATIESTVEQKLKDQRVETANKLVSYVKKGKPSEKVGAESILYNLGVYPHEVRGKFDHEKAVSVVASKLASW